MIAMNDKVDAGDILAQKNYEMKPDETTESLLTELNKLGGEIIIPVIENYAKGKIDAKKQDESKATYTMRMSKSDGQIDLNKPPDKAKLDRMIRAYYPWPTVWTKARIKNQELRIKFLPKQKLQVDGGKPMSLKDFFNGYPELKNQIEKLV